MNTKKEKKVVLLQLGKRFLDEEYSHVDEALEIAKSHFISDSNIKHAKAYIATVIEGYVKRDGILSLEKVYIDLVEQKTIFNKSKQKTNDE